MSEVVLGEIVILDVDGREILRDMMDDSSYRIKAVMGDNKLFLNFSADHPVIIPLYSRAYFKGERYTLLDEQKFTKVGMEHHAYRLELESFAGYLRTQTYEYFDQLKVVGDPESDFSLIAKPLVFIQLLVDNMNLKDAEGGWKVGTVIDAPEQLIDFKDMWCWDVLPYLAGKFKTEFEVDGKTVHFRKVEKRKDNPLPLAYGYEKGLTGGIERTNYKSRVGRLKLKSSDRNIDQSTYGSKTLKMPKNRTIAYKGVEYVTDSTGTKLERRVPLIKAPIVPEETLDLTAVYPKYEGTATEIITIDDSKSLYEFIDSALEIDFSKQVIAGETMTVIFQTGQVAGQEFDVEYIHKDRRFRIKPITKNGINYPQGALVPAVGDTYAVFHMRLPQEYITAAEEEVLQLMVEYLYENEQPQFSYKIPLNPIYTKRRWEEMGEYMDIGMMIRFSEPQYLAEPVDIRVTQVREYLHRPYSPEITLSNAVTGKTTGQIINELPNKDQGNDRERDEMKGFNQRLWQHAVEMLGLLEVAIKGYTEGISPAWIQTIVGLFGGGDALQFRFVKSKTNPERMGSGITYNNETKKLICPPGVVQHMTLGVSNISPEHKPEEYTYWVINKRLEVSTEGDAKPKYVYVKCRKLSDQAEYLVSNDPYDFDHADGHYYLLVGVLSSEFYGVRSYREIYGFTEIAGGQIVTEQIVDVDGWQYWDMMNKRFRIGDPNNFLSYNVERLKGLYIKGAIVQSPSGDVDYLEVDRGDYVLGAKYYPGDKVKYKGDIYKCLKETTGYQHPGDAGYWKKMVSKGDSGKGYSYVYKPWYKDTPPNPPINNGTGNATGTWWNYPDFDGMEYIYMCQAIYEDGKWSDWTAPRLFAERAKDGIAGQGYSYAYWPSDSVKPPVKPSKTTNGEATDGWLDKPDFNDKRYIYICQAIFKDGEWSDWSEPKLYAMKPEDGDPGPGIVYRGEFEKVPTPRIFYNNGARRDVVKYGSTYYIFNGLDASTHNTFVSGSWKTYGSQFVSVATDLLLAENANIGGWIFKNGRLESQEGTAFLNGKDGTVKITGEFESSRDGDRIIIDPVERALKMISEKIGETVKLENYAENSSFGMTYGGRLEMTRAIPGLKYLMSTILSGSGLDAISYAQNNDPLKRTRTLVNGGHISHGIYGGTPAFQVDFNPSNTPYLKDGDLTLRLAYLPRNSTGLSYGEVYADSSGTLKISL